MSTAITSGTYPRARSARAQNNWLQAIWLGLHRMSARRVAPELMRLAAQVEARDPALAVQLREAARSPMLD